MDSFDIFVIAVKSCLFTYFVCTYHKFRFDSYWFVLMSILFMEQILMQRIPNGNQVFVIVISLTLFIFQAVRRKRIFLSDLLIGMMAVLYVGLANVMALFIITYLLPWQNAILVAIVSTILTLVVMHFTSRRSDLWEKDFKQIWQFDLIIVLLIVIIGIDINDIIAGTNVTVIMYLRMITIAVLVILLYEFLRQLLLNKEESKHNELQLQEAKYREENNRLHKVNTEDLKKLQHNLKYLMMTILFHARNKDLAAIEEQANSFLGRLQNTSYVVATNNPYFDYVFNGVSYLYKLNKITLKKSFVISENSKINQMLVADKIVYCTRVVLDIADSMTVQTVDIKIEEEGYYYFVYYLLNYEEKRAMEECIACKAGQTFKIVWNEMYKTVRLSFVIDLEEIE